jgi:mannitol/fructose-specific phosphotransferase system IIA component (Ntr-type)
MFQEQDMCPDWVRLDTLLFLPVESLRPSPSNHMKDPTMRLSDYLREDLVMHELQARNMEEALERFGARFQEGGHVPSAPEAVRALSDREASHPTCLGRGVAVPHATVAGLLNPLLLVATASPPVPFGPPETEPVDIFFVLLSPPDREAEHIKLLARICRVTQHPENLDEIRSSSDSASLLDCLLRLDAQHV